jgi:hypothetical protein
MNVVELRLNEKQKLLTLLYLGKHITAATLLARLDGCEEMSLLRLEEPKTR